MDTLVKWVVKALVYGLVALYGLLMVSLAQCSAGVSGNW